MLIPVTNIQRFSTRDGDGIRTTVFFKGCPLRCKWCHNPETQSMKPQIFYTAQHCIGCGNCCKICPNQAHQIVEGRHCFAAEKCNGCGKCIAHCPTNAMESTVCLMSSEQIMEKVMRDEAFFGNSGGITLSGGEPLVHPQEAVKLLKMAKEKGISTAIETCGWFDSYYIPELVKYVDCFLWDYKDSDPNRHKENTGVFPQTILQNLHQIDGYPTQIVLRCILIKDINMLNEHYDAIAELYHRLSHCVRVDLLPYHAYGGSKMEQLGYPDNSHREWIPDKDAIERAAAYLKGLGVTIGQHENG